MKYLLMLLLLLIGAPAFAAGNSVAAVPTQIDIVLNEGFMIYGPFGNAGNCVVGNQLYVKKDHPQYNEIYATALAAFLGKYKIRAYVHGCELIGWYSAGSTYNSVYPYSTLSIMD